MYWINIHYSNQMHFESKCYVCVNMAKCLFSWLLPFPVYFHSFFSLSSCVHVVGCRSSIRVPEKRIGMVNVYTNPYIVNDEYIVPLALRTPTAHNPQLQSKILYSFHSSNSKFITRKKFQWCKRWQFDFEFQTLLSMRLHCNFFYFSVAFCPNYNIFAQSRFLPFHFSFWGTSIW